jgi:hypothetical protein
MPTPLVVERTPRHRFYLTYVTAGQLIVIVAIAAVMPEQVRPEQSGASTLTWTEVKFGLQSIVTRIWRTDKISDAKQELGSTGVQT